MKAFFVRWAVRICVLLFVLGVPFAALGGFSLFKSGQADAISSASTFAFDPNDVSGEYVVLINNNFHKDTIETWTDFFKGKDIPVVLDDISCLICRGDDGAKSFAEICQARLPENQMKIKSGNTLLLLSKGEYGKFDILILSKEFADLYNAYSISGNEYVTYVDVI